ncbi:hypothetical protein Poly24_38750 [Rosistilla carotiformis]|uniref:LTXXQ motif protein n=1 Tax=Rosistilla carotiformis TaxID=2528017 RepID=A0A518JXA3_9BACT|nr:hypothetical protein [Rosistilla carotiformis]QDV70156.1 hypothetical protein Poly24_38750 [Rosistilla carotiformis]
MNTTARWSTLLIFLCLLSPVAHAQPENRSRGESRRGGMQRYFNSGIMSLFRIPEVQAELELSRETAELIFALQADLFSEYRNARRDQSTDEALPSADEVSTQSGQVAERLLSAILDPAQFKRLQELWLQRRGLRAITMDDLADALELDTSQREATAELVQRISRGYGRGKISEEDAEVAKQITEILTPQQRKQWETMLGKPFDF